MRIPFATKSARGRSVPLSAERLVNLYAEQAPASAKSPVVVHGCPGLTRFADVSSDRPRGLHRTPRDGKLYLVAGQALYEIGSDGTATNLGTIAGAGRVGMADNGSQLCIVTGSKGYILEDGSLAEIADKDFPGADDVTVLDGFFVFLNPGSGQSGEQFFISGLYDGESFDALDFASAESYPDDLVRVFADHSELLLFGSETIETWFNSGGSFPFTRAQGSVIEQGLGAKWSIAKCDETVIWLDNEGSVRRLNGQTPARISTHAIEHSIGKGDWENATAWSYVEEGHSFYVLTVPAANLSQTAGTYVYDAATGLWHERKSHEKDYLRSGFYARAFGKHITCDRDRARLYEQSLDVYTEDGEHLVAEMTFPQVQADGGRFIVDRFELDADVGVGGVQPAASITSYTSTVALANSDDDTLRAYKLSDGSWSQTGSALTVAGMGNPALAAMSEDTLAYLDDALDELRAYRFDGSSWSQVGAALPVSGVAYPDLIALEKNLVVMVDRSLGLTAYEFDGSSWSQKGNNFALGSTSYPTMAYIGDGRIALHDVQEGGLNAYSFDGTDFVKVGNTLDIPETGAVGLAALTPGRIAAAANNQDTLTTYEFDGTDWAQVGATLSLTLNGVTRMGALSDDTVALKDAQSETISVYQFDGSAWAEVGSPSAMPAGTQYLCGFALYASAFDYVAPIDASDPQVMLDVSGNTRTFDKTQAWRSLGKQGEYDKRVTWPRLGQHRSFTARIAISSPVKRAIFAAYAKIRPTR